jgi:hypothetical protein
VDYATAAARAAGEGFQTQKDFHLLDRIERAAPVRGRPPGSFGVVFCVLFIQRGRD